jgi:uncharacterized protein with GYD domain
MASFIMAMTINPAAKRTHSDLQNKISDSLEVLSENKVKVTSLLATLGRYDILAQFEAPDQTVAFRVASQINAKGILETETWPVIPYDEFSEYL